MVGVRMFFGNVHAQENVLVSKEIKPSLGLGVGFLNYYGDVNSIGNQSSLMNQFAYEGFYCAKNKQLFRFRV